MLNNTLKKFMITILIIAMILTNTGFLVLADSIDDITTIANNEEQLLSSKYYEEMLKENSDEATINIETNISENENTSKILIEEEETTTLEEPEETEATTLEVLEETEATTLEEPEETETTTLEESKENDITNEVVESYETTAEEETSTKVLNDGEDASYTTECTTNNETSVTTANNIVDLEKIVATSSEVENIEDSENGATITSNESDISVDIATLSDLNIISEDIASVSEAIEMTSPLQLGTLYGSPETNTSDLGTLTFPAPDVCPDIYLELDSAKWNEIKRDMTGSKRAIFGYDYIPMNYRNWNWNLTMKHTWRHQDPVWKLYDSNDGDIEYWECWDASAIIPYYEREYDYVVGKARTYFIPFTVKAFSEYDEEEASYFVHRVFTERSINDCTKYGSADTEGDVHGYGLNSYYTGFFEINGESGFDTEAATTGLGWFQNGKRPGFYDSHHDIANRYNSTYNQIQDCFIFHTENKFTNMNLTEVDFLDGTSFRGNEFDNQFSNMPNLTRVNFPIDVDLTRITSAVGMFKDCPKLTLINIFGRSDFTYLTNAKEMFKNCSSLTTLDLSGAWKMPNLQNAESMFEGCTNLETINFGDMDFSQLTNTKNMFKGCKNLKTIKVESRNIDLSHITDCTDMFEGCENLVGGGGYKFNENYTDGIFARIDCGSILPGYFTYYGNETFSIDFDKIQWPTTATLSKNEITKIEFSTASSIGSYDSDVAIYTKGTNQYHGYLKGSTLIINWKDGYNLKWAENLSEAWKDWSALETIEGLDNVNIDYSVVRNASKMFSNTNFLSITLPANFCYNAVNLSEMFAACDNMETVIMNSSYNYAFDMSKMFENCSSLNSITVSVNFASNAQNFESMFSNCTSLINLDISNWDTGHVNNAKKMFYNCKKFTTLNLNSQSLKRAWNLESAFEGCDNFIGFTGSISSFENSSDERLIFQNLKIAKATFKGCTSLSVFSFDVCNSPYLTNTEEMFSGCSNLRTIYVNDNFQGLPNISYDNMFNGCTYLLGGQGFAYSDVEERAKSGEFARADYGGIMPGYYTINEAEYNDVVFDLNTDWYKATTLPKNEVKTIKFFNTSSYEGGIGSYDEMFYMSDADLTRAYVETNTKTVKIHYGQDIDTLRFKSSIEGMFKDFTSLESIEGIENIDASRVVNMSSMFSNCKSLKSIDFGNGFDLSNVKDMSYMFASCSSIDNIDFERFEINSIENMEGMFANCEGLKVVKFGLNFDTSNVVNMSHMFEGCSSLPSLDLSSFNTSSVTDMNYMSSMLSGCCLLSHIIISEDISNIINEQGLRGHWKDLTTNTIYSYDTSNYKTTIPACGGEYQRVNFYTITYHTNGGNVIPVEYYDANAYAYFQNPTRVGYEFKGWYSEPELTNKYENNYTNSIDRDYVLYAKWENVIYTIEFNTDGGSSITPQYKIYGELIDRPVNPTKDGYIFVNWYKEMAGTNIFDFTVPVTNHTMIYAKWREPTDAHYEVTFDMKGHGTSIAIQSIAEGRKVTKPIDPTADGYTFVGWYKEDTYQNLWNFNTDIVTELTVLYAKWTVNTYTIKYNVNGIGTTPSDIQKTYGIDVTLTNPSSIPAGYTFDGWYSDADLADGHRYEGNTDLTTSNNVELNIYARWNENIYDVNYHMDGGRWKANAHNKATRSYTERLILPTSDDIEKIVGDDVYKFDGWWTKDGNVETDWGVKAELINEGVSQDVDVYAKWKPIVLFNANGHGVAPASVAISGTQQVTLSSISESGWTFGGWYRNATEFTDANFVGFGGQTVLFNGPKILYAKWTASTYTITYHVNRGTWSESYTAPAEYNVLNASTVILPIESNITRNHYAFDGWYRTNDFSGTQVITLTGLTENLNLFAKWIIDAHYTITFLSGGGTGSMSPQYAFVGEDTILDEVVFVRDGYTFNGWSSDDGRTFTDGQNIEEVTTDLTLTATWTQNVTPYYPSYNPGGSGGSSGGGGGGGGGGKSAGPNSTNNTAPSVTKINQIKTIELAVDEKQINWVYEPISNKFKMNIEMAGQTVPATDGFYLVSTIDERKVNGMTTYVPGTSTYCFDKEGNMVTGWVNTVDNKWYYLENVKTVREGMMVFGWYQVQSKWYYFTADGTMLANATTPDGYFVGADGAWVQ